MSYLKRWGRNSLESLSSGCSLLNFRCPAAHLINNRLQKLKPMSLLLDWGAAQRTSSSAPRLLHRRESRCDAKQHPRGHREPSPQMPFGPSSSVLLTQRLKVGVYRLSWLKLQSTRRDNGFPASKPGHLVCFLFFNCKRCFKSIKSLL